MEPLIILVRLYITKNRWFDKFTNAFNSNSFVAAIMNVDENLRCSFKVLQPSDRIGAVGKEKSKNNTRPGTPMRTSTGSANTWSQ